MRISATKQVRYILMFLISLREKNICAIETKLTNTAIINIKVSFLQQNIAYELIISIIMNKTLCNDAIRN